MAASQHHWHDGRGRTFVRMYSPTGRLVCSVCPETGEEYHWLADGRVMRSGTWLVYPDCFMQLIGRTIAGAVCEYNRYSRGEMGKRDAEAVGIPLDAYWALVCRLVRSGQVGLTGLNVGEDSIYAE